MEQLLIKNKSSQVAKRPSFTAWQRAMLSKPVFSITPSIDEAGFDSLFEQLDRELALKHLNHVRIIKYFGDEWFCPERTTAIAIPFWLATRSLRSIERKYMGTVEGETDTEFMKLLRHEAGHCVDHAFHLSKRAAWQNCFGNPKQKYAPEKAITIPGHPDFVVNLEDGYAQTHPEEDFAETFAVWLDPRSDWAKKYETKPRALAKLMCVDQLMARCSRENPRKLNQIKSYNARRMRMSLEKYYDRRRSISH